MHCIALLKERESEMKKKLAVATSVKDSATPATISSSTPVMASIMKEETENRELVSCNVVDQNGIKNNISGEKEHGDSCQKE